MTGPDQQDPKRDSLLNSMTQQQRLRDHLTAGQEDKLISSLAIAIQRAHDTRAPQTVTIKITEKGYVRWIDPSDNSGPVE